MTLRSCLISSQITREQLTDTFDIVEIHLPTKYWPQIAELESDSGTIMFGKLHLPLCWFVNLRFDVYVQGRIQDFHRGPVLHISAVDKNGKEKNARWVCEGRQPPLPPLDAQQHHVLVFMFAL